MKRALSILSIFILLTSIACLAGSQKKPVKGKGHNALNITNTTDSTGNIIIPDYVIGQAITPFTFTASGGVPCVTGPAYTWSVDPITPLPTGLSLDTNTGILSGTPTVASFTFNVIVSDCGN